MTVDGRRGAVFEGDIVAALTPPARVGAEAGSGREQLVSVEPLGTRLYVNLAIADHAERVAALPVDGVGLLRAEFMITDALGGRHPRDLLAHGGRS